MSYCDRCAKLQLQQDNARLTRENVEMSGILAGSEYIDNPRAYVRAFRDKSDCIKEQTKKLATARATIEGLEKERDGLAASLLNAQDALRLIRGKGQEWGTTPVDLAQLAYAGLQTTYDPVTILAAHDRALLALMEERVEELMCFVQTFVKLYEKLQRSSYDLASMTDDLIAEARVLTGTAKDGN